MSDVRRHTCMSIRVMYFGLLLKMKCAVGTPFHIPIHLHGSLRLISDGTDDGGITCKLDLDRVVVSPPALGAITVLYCCCWFAPLIHCLVTCPAPLINCLVPPVLCTVPLTCCPMHCPAQLILFCDTCLALTQCPV